MGLSEETYENFYLGNATEFWIASQLYFHGFEASKYSPDFGIDLVVTNAARAKFKGEVLWTRFLQIKSTFLVEGRAKIYLNPEELEFLCSTPNIACVFCLVTPRIEAQPRSFDRGEFEPWRDSLDAEMDQDRYDNHFHQLKRDVGCLSSIDFKGFDLDYFWLTSEQLQRSTQEGFWNDETINGTGIKVLRIEKSGDHLSLYDPVGAHHLIDETRSMYYLYKSNNSTSEIERGAFHLGHY